MSSFFRVAVNAVRVSGFVCSATGSTAPHFIFLFAHGKSFHFYNAPHAESIRFKRFDFLLLPIFLHELLLVACCHEKSFAV